MAIAKTNRPELSDDAAQKLLNNVFDACNREPNNVPLEALESYSEYRREKYSFQKILLIVILAIFMLLPFCFICPELSVEKISTDDASLPQYRITVDGWFPIKLVSGQLNGRNINVYETGERTFVVQPVENGTMDINVRLINRQYDDATVEVAGIDTEAPYLVMDEHVGNYLLLYLQDDGLGIDWDGIYAEGSSGSFSPVSYDADISVARFRFPSESVNIFIPDLKGNTLQLVVTVS